MIKEKLKNRKANRWRGYDYAQEGWYFVTVCVKNREEYLGKIENNEMVLNKNGKIVEKCWLDLTNHYINCVLDEWIIMPNHVHGIVVIENNVVITPVGTGLSPVGTGFKPVPTPRCHSLSEIMRGFKTFSSRRINENNSQNIFHWQRSFYDHIIRGENSLNNIRQYIRNNPMKWKRDRNNQEDLFI